MRGFVAGVTVVACTILNISDTKWCYCLRISRKWKQQEQEQRTQPTRSASSCKFKKPQRRKTDFYLFNSITADNHYGFEMIEKEQRTRSLSRSTQGDEYPYAQYYDAIYFIYLRIIFLHVSASGFSLSLSTARSLSLLSAYDPIGDWNIALFALLIWFISYLIFSIFN